MQVSRTTHFQCDLCKQWKRKSQGLSIRMTYTTLMKPQAIKRSRTVGMKCLECLELDPVYVSDPYRGNRDVGPLSVEV